jgi:hypothetical protein
VQIIQNKINKLDFKIVRDDNFNEESLEILNHNIKSVFGNKMLFDVEFVEKIEQTERGKYRFSICNIPNMHKGDS